MRRVDGRQLFQLLIVRNVYFNGPASIRRIFAYCLKEARHI
jgi:hypothetical protein